MLLTFDSFPSLLLQSYKDHLLLPNLLWLLGFVMELQRSPPGSQISKDSRKISKRFVSCARDYIVNNRAPRWQQLFRSLVRTKQNLSKESKGSLMESSTSILQTPSLFEEHHQSIRNKIVRCEVSKER